PLPQARRSPRVLRGGDRRVEDGLARLAREGAAADRARPGGVRPGAGEALALGAARRAGAHRPDRRSHRKAARPRPHGPRAPQRGRAAGPRRPGAAGALRCGKAPGLELDRAAEPPGAVAQDQRTALAEVVEMSPAVLGESGGALDAHVDVGL